jgi:hypothetical protein
MRSTKFASRALAGALLLAGVGLAAPLQAQSDSTDNECAMMCRETLDNCVFDAHEAGAVCREGCDELRAAYRQACLVTDRDEEACNTARDDLRSCLDSCRGDEEDVAAACKDTADACLTDDCGLTLRRPHGRRPPPPRGFGR